MKPDYSKLETRLKFSRFFNQKYKVSSRSIAGIAKNGNINASTIGDYKSEDPERLKKAPRERTIENLLKGIDSNEEEFIAYLANLETSTLNNTPDQRIKDVESTEKETSPNFSDLNPESPKSSNGTRDKYRAYSIQKVIGIFLIIFLFGILWFNNKNENFYALGLLAKNNNEPSEAIIYFKKAIKDNVNKADAYYELADVYANQTNNDAAIKYYRLGIEKDPKSHSFAYNNLSLLLLENGNTNDALVLLDKAIKNVDSLDQQEQWAQKGIIFKNRAWAYLNNGNQSKALELISEAQKLLGPAQILNEFPEVFCIHALATLQVKMKALAEDECIKRMSAQQEKQQNGLLINSNRVILGLNYELYTRVLQQQEKGT